MLNPLIPQLYFRMNQHLSHSTHFLIKYIRIDQEQMIWPNKWSRSQFEFPYLVKQMVKKFTWHRAKIFAFSSKMQEPLQKFSFIGAKGQKVEILFLRKSSKLKGKCLQAGRFFYCEWGISFPAKTWRRCVKRTLVRVLRVEPIISLFDLANLYLRRS